MLVLSDFDPRCFNNWVPLLFIYCSLTFKSIYLSYYSSPEDYDEDEEDEEVQVILTFDKDGTEYTLVRELEPMLLVGKVPKPEDLNDDLTMDMRILLDAEESDAVVPKLMEMYNDDEDNEDE